MYLYNIDGCRGKSIVIKTDENLSAEKLIQIVELIFPHDNINDVWLRISNISNQTVIYDNYMEETYT
jgi:hypothetical protein